MRLALALSAPIAVSVDDTASVKLPEAFGVPEIKILPLPLCVAVRPVGKPVTVALIKGKTEPIIKLAEYASPRIAGGSCGVTNCGAE